MTRASKTWAPESTATTSLGLVLWCVVGCGGDHCRAVGDGHFACAVPLSRAPIVGMEGAFVVEGRVNGRLVELLIDTGADSTIISSGLLSVHDRTPQLLDELCVGSFCVAQEPVYAWETPFSAFNTNEPSGLVGMSLLRHLTLRFHYGRELTIGDGTDDCRGTSVPLVFTDRGIPIARGSVDSLELPDLALDTGATRSVLAQSTAEALGSDLLEAAVPTECCTVDGCTKDGAQRSVVGKWCVGDVCVEELEVKFPVWNAVGANWFARHDVRFDFEKRELVFCDM